MTKKALIKQELMNRLSVALRGRPVYDSFYNPVSKKHNRRVVRKVNRCVDRAIVIHDVKHNDILGSAIFIGTVKTAIIPILLAMIKNSAIDSVQRNIILPLVEKVVLKTKQYMTSKDDSRFGDSDRKTELAKDIKNLLIAIIKVVWRGGGLLVRGLLSAFSKIKNLV